MAAFTLNGAPATADLPGDVSLLHVLRGPLGLSSPRFGCGTEGCGACLVLVDGRPAYSCTLNLDAVAGRSVETVEGIGTPEAPHPVQAALLVEQAGQCGYCLSGIIVSAVALLRENPAPDEGAVRAALDRHLCR
ncbi:MAG TPA: 2Fe-2S iron-sulfur cluster-binding protein, partial [Acetobacteraceae bacterium]|nr:2Fe-2S iron-sulfur cluster-binding protein [Acetobacteraceae bacterium]